VEPAVADDAPHADGLARGLGTHRKK
jgi:hypothetical protein